MKRTDKRLHLLLMFTITAYSVFGQAQYEASFFIQDNDTLNYRVLYPEEFDKGNTYPLLLFLHGAGERGSDNKKQLVHGSSLFLRDSIRNAYPAIVIFPQCPTDDYWSNVIKNEARTRFEFIDGGVPTKSMQLLMSLLGDYLSKTFVDKQRVYVGGLSMGGMGTFEIVSRMPDTFAAAFPICGGGNPASVKKYADKVNFWIFHGALDNVVRPQHSTAMVLALQQADNPVRYTLYPNANHNSWDSAFAEKELLPWLFTNSKTTIKK